MVTEGISLVTGAAGFLGQHLVQHLIRAGHTVRASDRRVPDDPLFDPKAVEFVTADLTDRGSLAPLFDGPVTRVYHLGAICNFSTPYEQLHPVNVLGVSRITALARAHKVQRFVHVSSTALYGWPTGVAFTEQSEPAPRDAYGWSKFNGEEVLRGSVAQGLPAVVLRPCTVYGPGCTDGAGKAFSRKTSIAAIPGNGRQLLANVRVEDVAAAAAHLSTLPDDAIGQVYNIADDSRPELGEALGLAAEVFGATPPKLNLPLPLVATFARVDGLLAARRGKVPDLELDAVQYLYGDCVVDNSKLKATGFALTHPDFETSMRSLAR